MFVAEDTGWSVQGRDIGVAVGTLGMMVGSSSCKGCMGCTRKALASCYTLDMEHSSSEVADHHNKVVVAVVRN